LTGEEAIAIQEVGPGHLDDFEGVAAVPPQGVARAAARLDHLVVAARRGDDRAAQQADLGGAFPVEEAVDDAQQEVLGPGLRVHATPVAEDVWKYGSAGRCQQSVWIDIDIMKVIV